MSLKRFPRDIAIIAKTQTIYHALVLKQYNAFVQMRVTRSLHCSIVLD